MVTTKNRIGVYSAPLIISFYCLLLAGIGTQSTPVEAHPSKAHVFNLPFYFEKNEGQVDLRIAYVAHYHNCALYFTAQEMVMVLPNNASGHPVTLRFLGAQQDSLIEGLEQQDGMCNYFIGNDPKEWHTNIPTYAKIRYKNLYPGIDVLFYGTNGRLEYDVCVAPGSDPSILQLHIDGVKSLAIDDKGNLQMRIDDDQQLVMRKPHVYQVVDETRIAIDGSFILLSPTTLGFQIHDYDTSKALIIDPILDYSTYLGGSSGTFGSSIAVDDEGSIFVAGTTNSPDFPTTPGAYQTTLQGAGNSFITKLNMTNFTLVYSTYLGSGSSLRGDNASGLAIDTAGNAYVLGTTDSATFPTTPGAFQTTLKGLTNCFITKLNPTGSNLVYSTYLGGSAVDRGDVSSGIAVDAQEHAFVTGETRSSDFPTTPGAFQTALAGTNGNCFVTKLNALGTQLIYSTFLGGANSISNGDRGNDITVDANGNAYVVGQTESSDFPTTSGAFQTTLQGISDCFITKFNPAGSALVYSTFLGGSSFDFADGIALDDAGNAYIAGGTGSSNFPTTPGAFQITLNGPVNGIITKLNAAGSALVYSTFLGGAAEDAVFSIALDQEGNACVTGFASSLDFPVTADAFQATRVGTNDCVVTKLNADGSNLEYSTYMGGSGINIGTDIAVDSNAAISFTGFTSSLNFPVTPNAYQAALSGDQDCLVARFTFAPPAPTQFLGETLQNIFLLQTNYINHLSWTPNTNPMEIDGYKIFRNGVLLAQLPAGGPFFYNDYTFNYGQQYVYALVAFVGNTQSIPLTVRL